MVAAIQPTAARATSQIGAAMSAEKHNPTTLKHVRATFVPEAAPVLGAVGITGESSEQAEEAVEAFSRFAVEPPVVHEEKEQAISEKAVGDEESSCVPKGEGEGVAGADGNGEDDDVVYPAKLQLGLLTAGLCLATFTVALGMSCFDFSMS